MFSTISKKSKTSSSFTLVELLVVLAIIAVLATVIVLVINPAELLKQFRDASRINDLASINRALNYVLTDCPTCFFGSSSIVYVSIPDSSPTCANLGLPSLPSGWSYACSDFNNYRKVNGAGWIPVDFTKFSAGSPLSKLPVDPINTTSTGQYYTYVTGGSWALSSLFESQKYLKDKALTDGGYNPAKYETGSNLKLIAQSEGLVGWWSFDEGSGTIAKDSSGNDKNGTLYGGITWGTGANCKLGSSCLYAPNPPGGNTVAIPNNGTFNFGSGDFTIMGWVKIPQPPNYGCSIFGNYPHGGQIGDLVVGILDDRTNIFLSHRNLNGQFEWPYYNFSSYWNTWTHIIWTKTSSAVRLFINGVQVLSQTPSIAYNVSLYSNYWYIIGADWCHPQNANWYVDEHRVYNRALSAAEIKAIYDATK